MPILVDHAQRRTEVLDIAIDLIAEGGVEGASVRSIAQRADYSTAIVSHYFHDKAELLLLAFERTLEQMVPRVEAAMARSSALSAFEVFLPLDPMAAKTWKVWFAFWGIALSDPKYGKAQMLRGREGQELFQRMLDHYDDPPKAASGGRAMQAGRLFAMIAGIATQATFDPRGWPPARQRAMLAAELDALRKG